MRATMQVPGLDAPRLGLLADLRPAMNPSGSLAVLLLLALVSASCQMFSGAKQTKACLSLSASPQLNTYNGQPHAVTLHIFPLASSENFDRVPAEDLLGGHRPSEAVAEPIYLTVAPGEHMTFKEVFPPATRKIGVIADFYRAPGKPGGSRKQVVTADCGWGSPKLLLTSNELRSE